MTSDTIPESNTDETKLLFNLFNKGSTIFLLLRDCRYPGQVRLFSRPFSISTHRRDPLGLSSLDTHSCLSQRRLTVCRGLCYALTPAIAVEFCYLRNRVEIVLWLLLHYHSSNRCRVLLSPQSRRDCSVACATLSLQQSLLSLFSAIALRLFCGL